MPQGEGKSQGPSLAALQQMGSDKVMTSLTSGKMMEQAEGLSPAQILAIVSYLAGGKSESEDAMPASAWCTGKSISVDKALVGGWGVDAREHVFAGNASQRFDCRDRLDDGRRTIPSTESRPTAARSTARAYSLPMTCSLCSRATAILVRFRVTR